MAEWTDAYACLCPCVWVSVCLRTRVFLLFVPSTCKWHHNDEINYGNTHWNVDNEHECTYAIHLLFASYFESAFILLFFLFRCFCCQRAIYLPSSSSSSSSMSMGGKIQISVIRTKSLRPYRVSLKFLCKCLIRCSFFFLQIPFYV